MYFPQHTQPDIYLGLGLVGRFRYFARAMPISEMKVRALERPRSGTKINITDTRHCARYTIRALAGCFERAGGL